MFKSRRTRHTKTSLYVDCKNPAWRDSCVTEGRDWPQVEYSRYVHGFAWFEVSWSWHLWHTAWRRFPLCPQKQKLAKARRESETRRMRTTTTTMKTTIKSKTENESLPSYPSSPTNLNVRPPTSRTAFVIHVYPPQLWALFMGQDCTGWVGQVELPSPPLFFLPSTHGTESHPTPSTSPTPRPRGSQAAHHSAFHNFTVDPSLCIPVWGLWDWYLVLGLCF